MVQILGQVGASKHSRCVAQKRRHDELNRQLSDRWAPRRSDFPYSWACDVPLRRRQRVLVLDLSCQVL